MNQPSNRAKSIFLDAVELQDASQRNALVVAECGDDAVLQQEVERLLQNYGRLGSFLEAGDANSTIDQPITEKPGTQIGPYKLLQQIGEGGFGVVYMAEQTEPVERRVALKIIKPGMDTQQVIARFEAEEQALAMMDHPNIARVFEVGTTESGRPYFAMELVRGIPITQYCDEHHLTPCQRLELFVPVCHAIQHAHQKGIIHRDIKPTNVLVAEYDDRPVPKIIDFGVAKAIQQRLTERTMFTQFGQVVGTIDYMSPEQAKLNELDIDTRSDIYSLGVLLYELLTGDTPFDRQRLRSAAFDELLRIIREEEPPRPSTRLSSSHSLPSIAANRQTEPKKLSTLVRGELDWIVMKALEKDRTRRYETANGFASDIQRYLNDEPVVACPPTAAYRLKKLARRNKAAFATVATVVAVLLLGAVVSTWQALRATKAEHVASERLVSEQAAYQEASRAATEAKQARDREAQERRGAEQAREQEAEQRQAAVEAKNIAEAARKEADEQRQLASDREVLARRNLYTAHMNLAQDAWDENDIPRVLDLLQRHVPAPSEPDWRSFEWYHLLGLCHQDELTIACNHSGARPAFSPDGKILAVPVWKQIELWDLERRKCTKAIADNAGRGPVAFSPDGKVLASVACSRDTMLKGSPPDAELKLWDVATGAPIRSFGGHEHAIWSIAFTPDGQRIVSTDSGTTDSKNIPGVIRVWNVATGEQLYELRGHTGFIISIAISPDGSRLASAGLDGARFWNLVTGQPIEELRIAHFQNRVAWSPDGKFIATLGGGGVAIRESTTGQEVSQLTGPDLGWFAYSPDGHKLASGGNVVRLWDVKTGKELAVFKGHHQHMNDVVFSPDGKRFATTSRDCTVKVWPVVRTDPTQSLGGASRGSPYFTSGPGGDRTQLSPDGRLLAALRDASTVRLIDVQSGELRADLSIGAEVHALSFSADGQRIVVAHAGGMETWNVTEARKLVATTTEHPVWTIDVSPDGTLVAAGTADRRVEIYGADSLVRQTVVPWQYTVPVYKVAFSPDGTRLAVMRIGDPAEVHLWDVQDWQLRWAVERPAKAGLDLAFSRDGGMLAVSEGAPYTDQDGAVTRIFDVATGAEIAVLQGAGCGHLAVAFSGDGRTLATATEEGKITVWDVETYEERITFSWEGHSVESLAISSDGRTLVSSDNNASVRIWRTAGNEHVQQLESTGLARRAAQYTTEGHWQEAADLYSHLLEPADYVDVRFSRASAYAELGEWKNAASDLEMVVRGDNTGFRPWYELALMQLVQGDEVAYRKTCAEMLERFGRTDDALTAEFVCWTHSLSSQPDLDWGQLLSLAVAPFATGEAGASARRSLGAVLLRAGLYEDAVSELEAADKAVQQERNRTTAEYTWYLLAQAHARLSNLEAAQTYRDRTQPVTPPIATSDSRNTSAERLPWNRRATLELLRHETEALIATLSAKPSSGSSAEQTERLQRAVAIYSRAIELRDDIPLLQRLRARAKERLGASAESSADLTRAEELDREVPLRRLDAMVRAGGGDRMRLARAQYRFSALADYDGALEDCFGVLSDYIGSEYIGAHDLFFEVEKARGTLDSADADWRRELGDARMGAFYKARAEYYQQHGELDKAGADLDKLVELQPADPDALAARVVFHAERGHADKAAAHFRAALQSFADDSNARSAWLTRVANEELNASPSLGPVRRRVLEEAVAFYTELITLNPRDAAAHRQRGQVHEWLREFDQARADYEKAVELTPENAEYHRLVAGICRECPDESKRDLRCALEHAETAVRLEPENWWSHHDLAFVCFASGDAIRARDEFLRAADVCGPGWVGPALHARASEAVGDLRGALDWHTKAVAVAPDDPTVYSHLGVYSLSCGEYEQAITAATTVINSIYAGGNRRVGQSKDWLVALHSLRAAALTQAKRYQEAIEDYCKVVELDPSNSGAHVARGLVEFRSKNYDRALADLGKAQELEPESCDLRGIPLRLAAQCPEQRFRQGLLVLADKSIELTKGAAAAYVTRGRLYGAFGQPEQALADFNKAIELEPNRCDAWTSRAEFHADQGQPDQAAADFAKAVEVSSEKARDCGRLARCLATQPDRRLWKLDQAVELAKQAISLAYKDSSATVVWDGIGTYWNTLGVAQYRAGQWQAAVEALHKAIDFRGGGEASDWFFLAMAHWQLGNKEEAATWHHKAIEWMSKNEPDEEDVDELRRFAEEAAALLGAPENTTNKPAS